MTRFEHIPQSNVEIIREIKRVIDALRQVASQDEIVQSTTANMARVLLGTHEIQGDARLDSIATHQIPLIVDAFQRSLTAAVLREMPTDFTLTDLLRVNHQRAENAFSLQSASAAHNAKIDTDLRVVDLIGRINPDTVSITDLFDLYDFMCAHEKYIHATLKSQLQSIVKIKLYGILQKFDSVGSFTAVEPDQEGMSELTIRSKTSAARQVIQSSLTVANTISEPSDTAEYGYLIHISGRKNIATAFADLQPATV